MMCIVKNTVYSELRNYESTIDQPFNICDRIERLQAKIIVSSALGESIENNVVSHETD